MATSMMLLLQMLLVMVMMTVMILMKILLTVFTAILQRKTTVCQFSSIQFCRSDPDKIYLTNLSEVN